MFSRLWLVLGLVAALAAVLWWRWPAATALPTASEPLPRDPVATRPAATPDVPPVAAPPSVPTPVGPHAFTPSTRPALPTPVVVEPARLPSVSFAAEHRDDRWARPLEADLQRRIATVPTVHADGIECRATTCELTLTGPANAVSSAFETLAALHAPLTLSKSTGSTVTAYLAFPPPADADAPD